MGTLQRRLTKYNVWSLGEKDDDNDGLVLPDGEDRVIGGEEMKSFSCLLPRKSKKGKMYPTPIARHVVLSAINPPPDLEPPIPNSPRQRYPVELLTHQFKPYGSLLNTDNNNKAETHAENNDAEKEKDDEGEDEGEHVAIRNMFNALPPPPSTILGVGKSKSRKKSVIAVSDDEIAEVSMEKEKKKKKSKKRKNEDIVEVSSSTKSKRVKIAG